MNRREMFQNVGATLGVAGLAAILTQKQAVAQPGCGPVQHSESTVTQTYQSQCTGQTITATLVYKTTARTCTNADGSVTTTMHTQVHGTAQGYDPVTGQSTDYVVNEQERSSSVTGAPNGNTCQTFSSTQQYRELFLSKGRAPNEQVIVTETASGGPCGTNACCLSMGYSINPDCQGS